MKFKTYVYADISTGYLKPSDHELLKTAPNHLAELDGKNGDFFYTPMQPEGRDSLKDYKVRARKHGMSRRFIRIMVEVSKKSIPYVRFDSDGSEIQGMKPCKHAI
jgi:hypothetical protein